jgi:subtilisin family serine protease
MNKFRKKFSKLKKRTLALILATNLFLVATGSADLKISTDSADLQIATNSATSPTSTSSESIISEIPEEFNAPSKEVEKIDSSLYIEEEASPVIQADASGEYVVDEIRVKFKEGKTKGDVEKKVKDLDGKFFKAREHIPTKTLKVKPEKRDEILEKLKKDSDVEFANLNPIYRIGIYGPLGGEGSLGVVRDAVVNDPFYQSQWNLQKINTTQSWMHKQGSSSITVAVMDTGMNTLDDNALNLHPGWNFWDDNNDYHDVNGHGTAVASVIGATTNNGLEMAGIDRKANILPLRVTDVNGGSNARVLEEALSWVRNHSSAKVVNISLVGGSFDGGLGSEILKWQGDFGRGVIVAAAGYASPGEFESDCSIKYPAGYNGVFAVTATDENDQWYRGCGQLPYKIYSGEDPIRLSAPGKNIYALGLDGKAHLTEGTSIAAPHVAGVASVLYSCIYDGRLFSTLLVKDSLKAGLNDIGALGYDFPTGRGRINMFKALDTYCI